eukprot:TRINITY_DN9282_c0_g1_i1.p1 TRINITY_DN9282_c0_g1~~TRINITY_DN9282_c0_g1_i1.p1  ORF type:complete len:714 (-),score=117.53 TRINITY_DN9282_c0_g1_i1:217-2358(-)
MAFSFTKLGYLEAAVVDDERDGKFDGSSGALGSTLKLNAPSASKDRPISASSNKSNRSNKSADAGLSRARSSSKPRPVESGSGAKLPVPSRDRSLGLQGSRPVSRESSQQQQQNQQQQHRSSSKDSGTHRAPSRESSLRRPPSRESSLRRPSSRETSLRRPSSCDDNTATGDSKAVSRRGSAVTPIKQKLPSREDMEESLMSASPDDPLAQSPELEWTKRPNVNSHKEGNVIYQVTTASNQDGQRMHNPYLVRTVRIEPASPPVPGNGKPPVPGKKREQIVVTEKDLKRCGGDLRKLREVAIPQPISEDSVVVEERKPLELSFKSAFDQRCRQGGVDSRDPWKDVDNPEEARNFNEQDLVLNQVWIQAMQPRKITKEEEVHSSPGGKSQASMSPQMGTGYDSTSPPNARRSCSVSTRASSADPYAGYTVATWSSMAQARDADGYPLEVGRVSRRYRHLPPRRANSFSEKGARGEATMLPSVGLLPEKQGNRRRSTSRGRHGDPSTHNKPVTMRHPSPIQPIDFEEESEAKLKEQSAVTIARDKAKFYASAQKRGDMRTVWGSIDPETGEVECYQRDVGTRLESAYVSGRGSVPLAGLGEDFEGAIVTFGLRGAKEVSRIKTLDGAERDVFRVEVPAYSLEMKLNIIEPQSLFQGETWKLATSKDDKREELVERKIELFGTELVAPPSPSLPTVSAARQPTYFLNAGADWGQYA